MKNIFVALCLASASTSLVACSSDSTTPSNPPPPSLKTQIDRFGRPAVNTALNNSFVADGAAKGMAKDAYNADSNSANWSTAYKGEIAKNLAILDSLDKVCGNQLLAGTMPVAGRYDTLASTLAADSQWLNTASTTCTQYLAVELNATNVKANSDCGGRALTYDVIDATYSAVAVGAVSGVTDGIGADPGKTGGTAFPYLAAPQ